MRRFLVPAALGLVVGGLVALPFGVLVGFVAGLGAFVLSSMGILARMNAANDPMTAGLDMIEDLHPNLRQRIRPLLKSQEEIRSMIDKNRGNPILSVLSMDIESEVRHVVARSADLLVARGKLRKMMFGVAAAKSQLASLEARRIEETDQQIVASIDEAIAARKSEIGNYERLRVVDDRIEASIVAAESTLSELRSRVIKTIAESTDSEREYDRQELTEMARRLETISRTMEESTKALNLGDFES